MSNSSEPTKEYVSQLSQAVVTTRIRGGIPNNFTFNPNTGKLLFLSSNFTSNLYYVNLADITSNKSGETETLNPQLVIRSEALASDHKFTKEEQLLRERQRMTETGITSYFPTNDGEKLLIPSGNQLCVAEKKADHFAIENVYQSSGAMDPKWSSDGNLISFVRNDDILYLRTLSYIQLTLRTYLGSGFEIENCTPNYFCSWYVKFGNVNYINRVLNLFFLVADSKKSAGVSKFIMQVNLFVLSFAICEFLISH